MAIHIKELNVTLHIGENTNSEEKRKKRTRKTQNQLSPENQRALLDDTVREVLRVLNEQKER